MAEGVVGVIRLISLLEKASSDEDFGREILAFEVITKVLPAFSGSAEAELVSNLGGIPT